MPAHAPAPALPAVRSVLHRVAAVVALLFLLLPAAGCSIGGGAQPSAAEREPRDSPAAGRPTGFRPSGVLGEWDAARARAFADGDVSVLRTLYVPGSAAGTSDVALLRAYRQRGLRVEGMRMQLLAVEVLHETPRVLRLRVTDRLTGAVVVGEEARIALPRDHASTRVVELRRSPPGPWRVAWVRVPSSARSQGEGRSQGEPARLRSGRPPAGR